VESCHSFLSVGRPGLPEPEVNSGGARVVKARAAGEGSIRSLYGRSMSAACLIRLRSALFLAIGGEDRRFIMRGVERKATKQYALQVSPEIAPLFEQGYTRLVVEQPQTAPLAPRAFGFIPSVRATR